ncbi:g7127 [Coccomyxa viridis]|uniref:G7127 protein n=1 Tax=Coccomyxa viridis TaxID=1274662 RepID=A0ABP1FY88_9CHLO
MPCSRRRLFFAGSCQPNRRTDHDLSCPHSNTRTAIFVSCFATAASGSTCVAGCNSPLGQRPALMILLCSLLSASDVGANAEEVV